MGAALAVALILFIILVEARRGDYLVKTVPKHIASRLLRHIVVALFGHHPCCRYELILLQVREIDILRPLLQATAYWHDGDIFEFVISPLSESWSRDPLRCLSALESLPERFSSSSAIARESALCERPCVGSKEGGTFASCGILPCLSR